MCLFRIFHPSESSSDILKRFVMKSPTISEKSAQVQDAVELGTLELEIIHKMSLWSI